MLFAVHNVNHTHIRSHLAHAVGKINEVKKEKCIILGNVLCGSQKLDEQVKRKTIVTEQGIRDPVIFH